MEKENIDDFIERLWFTGFCNKDEIDRIIKPKNAGDFLLSRRANIIADNPRYTRVFLQKSQMINNWSFEQSFSRRHYGDYLSSLSFLDRERCKTISYGDMFTNEINGFAESNKEWGRLIYLNESFTFFMKFCNLALFDFGNQVPTYIKENSLRIAARIILKTEAMDFFMDPRGMIPAHILNKIVNPIKYEQQFIAGHEFAHHLCDHFNEEKTSKQTFLKTDDNDYFANVYSLSQQNEFEADVDSLKRPNYNSKEYAKVYEAALIWFLSLDIAETVEDIINPIPSYQKSHPNSMDRIKNIIENTKKPDGMDKDKLISIQNNATRMKTFLAEDIALNIESYEVYGSAYLDRPNSEWRGRELLDRVDY